MTRLCLVLLSRAGAEPTPDDPSVGPIVAALALSGYQVEVTPPADPPADGAEGLWPWSTGARGASAGVLSAWKSSQASLLLALDLRDGYQAADVVGVAGRLLGDPETIVLGSRFAVSHGPAPVCRLRGLAGRLMKALTGSTDPMTGLVGLSRSAFELAGLRFQPVGQRTALEFLLKCPGATVDSPVAGGRLLRVLPRDLDDIRQLKRLANHRLGNLSRLLQFCAVGFSGMIVDLTAFALLGLVLAHGPLAARSLQILGQPLDLSWVVAAGLSISMALIWNFTLNRQFTFSDSRRHSGLVRQFVTYALSNALAVSLSFLLRLGLPLKFAFFRDHRLTAAVAGVVVATAVSFSMSRWLVFRPKRGTEPAGRRARVRSRSGRSRLGPAPRRESDSREDAAELASPA